MENAASHAFVKFDSRSKLIKAMVSVSFNNLMSGHM